MNIYEDECLISLPQFEHFDNELLKDKIKLVPTQKITVRM